MQATTYSVIAHSIQASTIDMQRYEKLREQILLDKKLFIPQAEIKYVGWLARNTSTKTAHSIIIKFSKLGRRKPIF